MQPEILPSALKLPTISLNLALFTSRICQTTLAENSTMSALTRLIPSITSFISRPLHQIVAPSILTSQNALESSAGGLFHTTIRTMIRCHFPRPSERKRILRHGWKKRLSTREGRRVLMNRILKGRFVYSH